MTKACVTALGMQFSLLHDKSDNCCGKGSNSEGTTSIDPGKIEIQLTELDIHNTFRTAADQKSVATKYQSLFNMLVDSRRNQKINITGVTFWGLTDGDSWLSDFKGETSYPLLFGADYAAKSAYLLC